MALSNCQACGKLFNRVRSRMCPACVEQEQTEFECVRAYMRENDVRFVVDLAEGSGVDRAKILKWIEEGKLELEVQANASVQNGCKRCGWHTDSGDLCEKCRHEMAEQIAKQRAQMQGTTPLERGTSATPSSPPTSGGMHAGPR